MATVYDPKTKRYVDQGSAKTRPKKNYDFSLSIEDFNKKYNTVRYTPDEFKALGQRGYVGSFGSGNLGFKAPAYQIKQALKDVRSGKTPSHFTLPANYSGSNLVDLAQTPNPTAGEMGAWYNRAKDFNLNDYIKQYGHAPSEDSVYYQIYKPAEGIASGLTDMRDDAVEVYGVERDQADRYALIRLAKATNDPNIRALSETLPTASAFTSSQRKKATQVLRDFGLTGGGAATVPFDLGSKYMLPASDPSGSSTNSTGTTIADANPEGEKSVASKIFSYSVLGQLAESETLKDLVTNPEGPLAPTKAADVNPISFMGNLVKGAARAGLGFPMGVAEMVANPIETTKSILKDYEYRYGSLWGNEDSQFIASMLEDPLAPLMDVLSAVPIVGAGVKAAQVGKIAATTTKGVRPAAGDINAEAVARAVTIVEEAEKATGPWATKGAGVAEARETIGQAAEGIIRAAPDTTERVTRQGLSAYEFARIQRAALNNDVRAELAMGEYGSNGYMGINSGYAPTFIDKAAAYFEPRWSYYTTADVLPDSPDPAAVRSFNKQIRDADNVTGNETIEGFAPIRFAGSPLARAAQSVLFSSQKAVARRSLDGSGNAGVQKIAGTIANLPLTGFNYRYAKALQSDVNSVGTLIQREFLNHRMFEELIDVKGNHKAGALSDAEQLAIMSQVSGKIYSPQMLRSIVLRRLDLDEKNPGLLSEDSRALLEQRLAEYESDEFINAYIKATREMLEPGAEGARTPRGQRLAEARDHFKRKHDLIHHEAGIELSALDVEAQARIYAPVINALRLEPETILTEINDVTRGSKTPAVRRVAKLNPNKDLFEIMRVFDMPASSAGTTLLTRINNGDFDDVSVKVFGEADRPLTRAEQKAEYARLQEEFEVAREELASEPAFRSGGGAPFMVVESVEKTPFGTWVAKVKVAKVSGRYDAPGAPAERSPIFSGEEISLPLEVFLRGKGKTKDGAPRLQYYQIKKKDKDTGLYIPDEEFYEHLQRGAVNYAMKQFPDARDFSDKIGVENFKGREQFEQKQNEGTVVASGFLDYHLETQFAAHRSAVNNRFNRDIQQTVQNAAIPVTLASFSAVKDQYVALRTAKVHATKAEADNYAANYSSSGYSEPGRVDEVTINGETRFVTTMKFVDASKEAIKETRLKQTMKAEEWQQKLVKPLEELDFNSPDDIVMVVPKRLMNDLTKSYERSTALSAQIFSGATDLFKLAALSLNPRFVSQQVFGGAVMMMLAEPMQAGHIMSAFMQYGYRNMSRYAKRKGGRDIDDAFINHKDDYDIFMNKFIRDFEDNIYMQDAQDSFLTKFGQGGSAVGKKAASALNIGYTLSFALEKNLRVAIMRSAAMNFPGFKDFLDSDAVAIRAAQGMPELGYAEISKFNAAVDLLSDTSSPYRNDMFLREIRHTADTVSGNYRDFTKAERAVRNTLIPFYAWTRHSAMFTKRLVQDRPLTANSVYNVGNYGYEQIFERGGMPEWLLESVPMPDFVENILGLDPERDNRIGFGSINPFGTTAKSITTLANIAIGDGLASPNSAFDFTNPFINLAVEQQTGKSLLTGAPLPTAGKGIFPGSAQMLGGLPLGKLILNSYKSSNQLNELRGRSNPLDVFKDPDDPESKLRVPEDKLNYKFPTFTPAGLWNAFAPSTAYSLDRKQLGEAIDREYEARGIEYKQNEMDRTKGAWKTIGSLSKWMATRDYINNVWLPEFGQQDPALTARVLQQMQAEFPDIPDTFPRSMVNDVLTGRLTIPEAANTIVGTDTSKPITRAPRVEVVNPDPVEVSRMGSDPNNVSYEAPAGTVNKRKDISVDSQGYLKVNNRVAVDARGKRVRYLVDENGRLVFDENNLPILVSDDDAKDSAFWDSFNPNNTTKPRDTYLEPWTIGRDDWADGGSIKPRGVEV
jgi:hypothetical protein